MNEYDKHCYLFCHPESSIFAYRFLCVGKSLKIAPHILLLSNPRISAHDYFYLSVNSFCLLILGKFILCQFVTEVPSSILISIQSIAIYVSYFPIKGYLLYLFIFFLNSL